jgi:hypothetical protein
MFHNFAAIKTYQERFNRNSVSDDVYRKLFRFSKPNVEWLSHHFLSESLETRGGALSSLQCMEVTLSYLSDPGFQNSVAQVMGVSQSTVSNVLSRSFPSIVS